MTHIDQSESNLFYTTTQGYEWTADHIAVYTIYKKDSAERLDYLMAVLDTNLQYLMLLMH